MATRAVSRRSVVKLAYGAPVVAASMRLRSVGAQEAVSPVHTCPDRGYWFAGYVLTADTLHPVYPCRIDSYGGDQPYFFNTDPTGWATGCVYPNSSFSEILGDSDGRSCGCTFDYDCRDTYLPDGRHVYLLQTCYP